jgi:hypothetical protein
MRTFTPTAKPTRRCFGSKSKSIVFDTVEVCGSSPHGPTISFSELASTGFLGQAPIGSIKEAVPRHNFIRARFDRVLSPRGGIEMTIRPLNSWLFVVLSIGPRGSAPQVHIRMQFEEVERQPARQPGSSGRIPRAAASDAARCGRGRRRFRTTSCWRNTRFPQSRGRRVRKSRASTPNQSRNRLNMAVSYNKPPRERVSYVADSLERKHFGGAQAKGGWPSASATRQISPPLILPLLPSSGKIVGCWQFSFRFTDSGLEAFLVEGNCRHWVLLRYFDSGGYLRQQFLLRRRSHFFAGTSSPPLSHAYGRAH